MVTLRNEVRQNVKYITDLDYLRRRYRQHDADLDLVVTYPEYEIFAYSKNLFTLLLNSEKVSFKTRWKMRPDYVSYDYYNTVIHWPLILYINNIPSIEDFRDLTEIIVPNVNNINLIARDRSEIEDVIDVSLETELDNNTRYYKRYPLDELEVDRVLAEQNISDSSTSPSSTCITKEKEETFTLTADDSTNGYIELEYVPLNVDTITLTINDFVTKQVYGYDFVLINDASGQNKRISWLDDDCPHGSGMEYFIGTGDILHITYLYAELDCNTCSPENYNIIDGGTFT